MNFQFVQPSGFLKNYIRRYCFMESDACEGNVMERVIPVENVQLMFHYKDPFVVCHSDYTLAKQPRSIISGLSNSFCDVSTNGDAGVVFVAFYPAGACHFFDFPLSEIENQSIDLSEIFNKEIKQVEETLYLKKSIQERVNVIEAFLLKNYSCFDPHEDLLIIRGVELIRQYRGQISANTLSDKLSVTLKSLERKFSCRLGKTPKQYIKLVRFQETLKDFSKNKDINLTEYAYRNGYFDQAHFIKDFKTYSGYTPGEFISKYPDFSMDIPC
jgi:AraC-like DNA-binding protein